MTPTEPGWYWLHDDDSLQPDGNWGGWRPVLVTWERFPPPTSPRRLVWWLNDDDWADVVDGGWGPRISPPDEGPNRVLVDKR